MQAGRGTSAYSTPEEIEARNVAEGRDPKLGYDNFERDLTEEEKCGVPGRRATTGVAASRAGHATSLHRPRSRRHHVQLWRAFPTSWSPRPTASRSTPHQPARRRADGHHARVARRGPPPAPRGRSRCTRRSPGRHRQWHAGVRASALVTGEGNRSSPSAIRSRTCSTTGTADSSPKGLINYLALLGWSVAAGPRRVYPRRDGRGVRGREVSSEPSAVRPEEGRGDQRRPHLRMLDADDFARRLEPYVVAELAGATPVMSDTLGEAQRPRSSPRRHWCRSAARCCRTPRGC